MGRYPKGKTTMYIDGKVLATLNYMKEPGETLSHVIWRLIQEHDEKKTVRRLKA